MKKSIITFVASLAVFSLAMTFSISTQPAHAQTINCPAGYTCTPITPQFSGCPVGYTCTPITTTASSPISNPGTGVTNPTACYNLSDHLGLGSRSADVVALQTFLIAKGYDIPLISHGGVAKGYFGPSTASALAKYQNSIGVSPTGIFGAVTRANINSILCNSNTNPQSPTSATSASFTVNGTPTFTQNVLNTDQSGNQITQYSASFNIQVSALDGNILLGLPGSTYPFISAAVPFISIYKNGVADSLSNYTAIASYAQPANTTIVNGSSFAVVKNQTVTVPVTITFQVRNPGANVYGIQLNQVAWSTPLPSASNQVAILTGSNFAGNGVPQQPTTCPSGQTWNGTTCVTTTTSSDQLSISSVSGPTTIQQGQSAMWTVNSNVSNLSVPSGRIMYSVDWGNGENMTVQPSNTIAHTYPNAGSYSVKFEVYDTQTNGVGNDVKTLYITVTGTNSSSIQVLAPQSGQTYNIGDTLNIRWSGAMKLISIKDLDTNTSRTVTQLPLTSVGDTSGSYNYVLPSDILGGFRTGTFSVSVYNSYGTNPEIFNSSAPFTIQASATACTSGQIWSNGACVTAPSISISAINPSSAVAGTAITISGNGFQQYDQACFATNGIINQCVTPSSISSNQISLTVPSLAAGTYGVRARRGDFLQSNELSFTINSQTPTCPSGQVWSGSMCTIVSSSQYNIKILSPNGGEQFTQGQTVPISFSTNLTSQQAPNGFNIILYYGGNSTNAGMFSSGVQTVAFRYTGGSPYSWSIPANLATGNYVAYIVPDQLASGIPSTGLFDFGDNYFTVNASSVTSQPTLSITAPSGGSYQAGGTLNIQWNATGLTQTTNSLGLAVYETSLGSTHSLLSTTVGNPVSGGQVSNSGSYNWTIPSSAPAGSDYVVYLSNSSGWKQSDPFTITAQAASNATPQVSISGTPTITKNTITTGGGTTQINQYMASFNVSVQASGGSVTLGLPSSSWPAFVATAAGVQINKNGASDTLSNYNPVISYSAPSNVTISSDGNSFTVGQNQSVTIPVTVAFTVTNPGANVYSVQLLGMGWSSATQSNQIAPLGGSTWQTQSAMSSDNSSLTASIWDAIRQYYAGQ